MAEDGREESLARPAAVGAFSGSEEYSEAGGVRGADTVDTYTNCGDGGAPSLPELVDGVSGGVGAAKVTVLGAGSGGSDLESKSPGLLVEPVGDRFRSRNDLEKVPDRGRVSRVNRRVEPIEDFHKSVKFYSGFFNLVRV